MTKPARCGQAALLFSPGAGAAESGRTRSGRREWSSASGHGESAQHRGAPAPPPLPAQASPRLGSGNRQGNAGREVRTVLQGLQASVWGAAGGVGRAAEEPGARPSPPWLRPAAGGEAALQEAVGAPRFTSRPPGPAGRARFLARSRSRPQGRPGRGSCGAPRPSPSPAALRRQGAGSATSGRCPVSQGPPGPPPPVLPPPADAVPGTRRRSAASAPAPAPRLRGPDGRREQLPRLEGGRRALPAAHSPATAARMARASRPGGRAPPGERRPEAAALPRRRSARPAARSWRGPETPPCPLLAGRQAPSPAASGRSGYAARAAGKGQPERTSWLDVCESDSQKPVDSLMSLACGEGFWAATRMFPSGGRRSSFPEVQEAREEPLPGTQALPARAHEPLAARSPPASPGP
ncbi:FOXL2 neighbor protein [Diceros bicornis minor]|uniref:FOXL2 neighbor protein n=1 Tax=Diceros bicornis minor TaxID=77932 RepID=UPI0026EB38D4|nr:FOXL2 neighbor protein [Diceros bicornis minor]